MKKRKERFLQILSKPLIFSTSQLLILTVMTCFFSASISVAQTLPFKHYSVEDGLASSSVNCIFQDSRGFLWIGTEHGLSRFDGIQFENFHQGAGVPKGYVLDICEDREGNIWIGTDKEGAVRFHGGEFKCYNTKNGLPDNHVTSIVEDREGGMWLGTGSGACKFDGKSFTVYTKKHGLIADFVKCAAVDKEGTLWFGTEKGISCFKKGRFISYTTDNGLIYNTVLALMTDGKGNTWIGTRGGLSCFRQGTFTSYSPKNGLPGSEVMSIVEDRNGNIWIGTGNGASYFCDGDFTNYNTANGLLNDKVYALFEDREGNVWFGTVVGLSKLNSLRIVNFSVKHGLPHNLVWAIIEERPDKYWIGTEKGLSCFSRGIFKNYTTADGLVSNSIYKLMKDRWGKIWIAGERGVSVYSGGSGGTFTNYTAAEGLPHHTVISLLEDRNGVVWLGTIRGLCRFKNGVIEPPGFEHEALPIPALLEDREGNLWFSDNKELHKISGDKRIRYSTRDGLIHNIIYSLFEDSRGGIWIGTQRGLSCFNRGKFTNYTTADGLSSDVCYFVQEDGGGNLWIGTTRGINRFDGKTFKTYTPRDGLPSYEVSQGACMRDSRGYLWFGTVNGLTRFNPELDRVNTVPPPVYITNLNVFGKDYPLSPTPPDPGIRLKYNQNYLGFTFIGLSFTSPEDVSYRYRLQGIDMDWFETRNRYISYTYLSPGEYVFKVMARNNDGVESMKPAEIRFRILPPFWQTWWFRLLTALSFLSLFAAAVLWRIKRVKEKIADEVRNKQLVMAQRMELLGILAGGAVHDLKNLLSIIIGYSKIAVQQADHGDEKIKPIENIKNTAVTAVQVVKQILAFTRLKYDETVAANLADLLDDILEILKVTTPAEINIHWQRPQQEVLLYINPTRFQQVVMNLCLNAVQAMEDGGELVIRLYKDRDQGVALEVADTGTGIDKEIADKIFDPLFTSKEPGKGTGLGLSVVKQIVAEFKGKIDVQSKPGEGTVFKISFPPNSPCLHP